MSIEDVDFMIQNCDKDSLVLFIDSAQRDKRFYPNPEEYVVNFDQPIRNVFGIDILDATIPCSLWNINDANNMFAFSQVFPSMGSSRDDFRVWFDEIQYNGTFSMLFDGNFNTEIFICTNRDNYTTLKNKVPAVPSSYNAVFERVVIMPTDQLDSFSYSATAVQQPGYHSITRSINPEVDKLNQNIHVFKFDTVMYRISIHDTYLPIIKSNEFFITDDVHLVYYNCFHVSDTSLPVVMQEDEDGTHLFDMYICNTCFWMEKGNYDTKSLQEYINPTLEAIAKNRNNYIITNGVYPRAIQQNVFGDITKQSLMAWTYDSVECPLVFDMKKSTCFEVFGFSRYASDNDAHLYQRLPHRSNSSLFMSIIPFSSSGSTSEMIVPPGIINLSSIRYILLKIPEIEQHINASYSSTKNFPGISLFKLSAGNNEIMSLRFDFVSILKKPFHPIGKMSRMHLRFETSTGTLYDFKGIDHTLIVSFNYYSPKNINRVPRSMLNPNYNPNVLEYILEDRDINDDEDYSKFDNPTIIKQMMLEQKKYGYSSDEEDSDHESDG